MASFPAALKSFTNPNTTDYLDSPSHADQHGDENDEIVAIETKVGTGATSAAANTVLSGTGAGTSSWQTYLSLTVANTINKIVATLVQNDTTNNPVALSITNTGTGNALYINQDGNGRSINIDSEATTVNDIYIDSSNNGTGGTSQLRHSEYILCSGVGGGLFIESAAARAASTNLLSIYDASTTNTRDTVQIWSKGTGRAILLDRDTPCAYDFYYDIDYLNTATGAAQWPFGIEINRTSTVTDGNTYTLAGSALTVEGDATETSGTITDTSILVGFNQAHTTCTGATLKITSAQGSGGSGGNLTLDSNNALGNAIYVDTEATTAHGMWIYADVLTTGSAGTFYSNSDVFTGVGLLNATIDHTSASGTALRVYNDGTGYGIFADENGNGTALYIDSESTTAGIRLDGCTGTSTKNPETDTETGFIKVNVDGTDRYIPYYAA